MLDFYIRQINVADAALRLRAAMRDFRRAQSDRMREACRYVRGVMIARAPVRHDKRGKGPAKFISRTRKRKDGTYSRSARMVRRMPGNLKKSIGFRIFRDSGLSVYGKIKPTKRAFYWYFLEFGTGEFFSRGYGARSRGRLRMKPYARTFRTAGRKRGLSRVPFWRQEYRNRRRGMRPRPFVGPTARVVVDRVREILGDAFRVFRHGA